MAKADTVYIGPRKGDPIYGDDFDKWAGREDELISEMRAGYARDIAALRGHFPLLPWEDEMVVLPRDRAKLLGLIADAAGNYPRNDEMICRDLGMRAVVNATGTINGALRAGMVEARQDVDGVEVLGLTKYGRDILDLYEEDPNLFKSVIAA